MTLQATSNHTKLSLLIKLIQFNKIQFLKNNNKSSHLLMTLFLNNKIPLLFITIKLLMINIPQLIKVNMFPLMILSQLMIHPLIMMMVQLREEMMLQLFQVLTYFSELSTQPHLMREILTVSSHWSAFLKLTESSNLRNKELT